jgi:hypothetical protein
VTFWFLQLSDTAASFTRVVTNPSAFSKVGKAKTESAMHAMENLIRFVIPHALPEGLSKANG